MMPMNPRCADLIRFADGELDPEQAEEFRAHLRTCALCRAGLVEALQLSARLGGLAPRADQRDLSRELPRPPAPTPVRSEPGPPKPRPPRSRQVAVGLVAAAAAAIAVVLLWPRGSGAQHPFAALTTRPYDIRFAYGDASDYRPTRDEMLGHDGASGETLPYAALDAFQRHGDRYALAIARAVNGEKLTAVAAQLRELDATPSIRIDRAAIEILLKGKDLASHNDDLDAILAELESLKNGHDAIARAARWNYAILLARLDLPLSAAREFQAIADEHEPGWADEARRRAAQARDQDLQARWNAAITAGEALLATGTPVPTELVRRFPGTMRAYFYNALASAPSPERVRALTPMAAELDRLGSNTALSDEVQRIASLDFRRRAALAAVYAQIHQGKRLAAADRAALTAADPPPDVADIVLSAMFELDAIADHLDAFRRMVKRAGDPWFEIVLEQDEATADLRRGDPLAAEARLRQTLQRCSPAVNYRCLSVARGLVALYQDLYRIPEAIALGEAWLRTARSAGEWGQTLGMLLRVGDAERFNSSLATTRAYAGEALLMTPEGHTQHRAAQMLLVGIAIRELDGSAARSALDLARHGEDPARSDEKRALSIANSLADIGRLDPRPDDLAQLRAWLSALRTRGTLTAGEQVLADEIEGRLLIESDRTAGSSLLTRAIAAAAAIPRDVIAEKARTGAYSVLQLDAARHGDHARVMTLLAQQLGLPDPAPCTVAMAAEDERAVVVVRGSDGRDDGHYESRRRVIDPAPSVSADLSRGLRGCGHVWVMANPMLHGQPRAVPADLPWSYLTGSRSQPASRSAAPPEPRALIVANVIPPDALQLPPLSPWIPDSTSRTTVLSGPAATPEAVLAEMARATEIQFHTHALVAGGVSDASHLVLSAGSNGSYALTAEAIRGTELQGRPIVVLAACDSAQGAHYQYAAWSLPDAFLSAGARAVLASAARLPDQEAAQFFARVMDQIRLGTDPAVALRDARMAALAAKPSSWAADVILFEGREH
jgi:hypothetical protein